MEFPLYDIPRLYDRVMRGKWLLLSGVVILAAVALGALSLMRREAPKPQTAADSPASLRPPVGEISLPGRIQAQHVVAVGVTIAGEIESFEADVGQEVSEGQVLARIASREMETTREIAAKAAESAQNRVQNIESRILAARLEASRARADANRSRDEHEHARKTYDRQKLLHSEGATPRLVYERAQRDFEAAQMEFRALEEIARQAEDRVSALNRELQLAQKALEDKQRELNDAASSLAAAEIRSPVTGLVVGRRGEPGQTIDPEEAKELLQVAVDLSLLEVVVDPEPPVLARLRPGLPALVLVADAPEPLSGTVKEIKGSQAIVEFVSPTPGIKPGMTAQAKIRLE